MAAPDILISAATIDPALLAALKAAAPEQVGDDLVLRLPDGRVFYIDGFFAANEVGDGLAPEPGATPLSRDIADLLLGAEDVATAAGGEAPAAPLSSGAGFIPFDAAPATSTLGDAPKPADPDGFGDDADRRDRLVSRLRDTSDIDQAEAGNGARASAGSAPSFNLFGSGFLGSSSFGGGGLPPSGAVSMSASSISSPAFAFSINLTRLAQLQELTDPAYAGWFSNIRHLLPMTVELTYAQFAAAENFPEADVLGPGAFAAYQFLRTQFTQFAAGHEVWLADPTGFGVHSNTALYPVGADLAQVFAGDDIIFGTSTLTAGKGSVDELSGFGGNDLIVAYDGTNRIFGGAGDDTLVVSQMTGQSVSDGIHYPQFTQIDGGDGQDTLTLQVFDARYPFDLTTYPDTITSIEILNLQVYVPNQVDQSNTILVPGTPTFMVTDGRGFALEDGAPIVILDAETVAAWGGTLTINAPFGDVHFKDVGAWTRLPDDPQLPGYAHYQAIHDGATVSLAVALTLTQPIDTAVVGTADNDMLAYLWRSFTSYDGGTGDDTITTALTPYIASPPGFGTLDLSNPATPTFHNIESIHLVEGDQIILSAASVAAVTDARNTLWISSAFAIQQNNAAGGVVLTDADQWHALGYASFITGFGASNLPEYRTGMIYSAAVNGETVQLFVSAGIDLPAGVDISGIDTWSIWYDGVVALPPPGIEVDLATIDFGGGSQANSLALSIADARSLAGDDHAISIVTDGVNDVVTFTDPDHWQLAGVERGANGAPDFYVYLGHDGAGADVTLRLDIELIEPALNLHPTTGDDLLRITEKMPDNLDGQGGFDMLQVLGSNSEMAGGLDLAAMGDKGPSHIEVLDLRNGADNNLILDTDAVARLTGNDVLYVIGDDPSDGFDAVFLQDVGNWTRTGVLASSNPGSPDFVRYETDAVINGATMHLTLAIEGDLGQPIGAPLP